MISVNDLSAYYIHNNVKNYILKNITFSLNKGDCLGIIGKSGDGKSTLAKSLLDITETNIHLENKNIFINNHPLASNDIGTKISLLFQNPNSYLNPLMKVGKQISEMLIYHHKEKKNIAKYKSLNFMKELEINNAETVYNLYPHELSGGIQQRICLCISLICNPEILILDECTSFLDKETKINILNLIKKLQSKYKFTLILISHDFNEITFLCNKVAIMRKGKIVEFGTLEEIINNPLHPYTVEIFYDYLRYYHNVEQINFEYTISQDSIKTITNTHFVRQVELLNETCIKQFKLNEVTFHETIRSKQLEYLLQK